MKKTLLIFLLLLCFTTSFAQSNDQVMSEHLATLTNKGINVRANILSWVVFTPSVGIEYRLNKKWGLILDGSYARWDWKDDTRRHRLWQLKPQVRRYFAGMRDSYLGLEYNAGQYSFNWSGDGKEANYMGGSLALGHQFYAGRRVLIDVGFSLGYLRLSDRLKYERIGNKDIKNNLNDKNYWGLTGLSMTLVWKVF